MSPCNSKLSLMNEWCPSCLDCLDSLGLWPAWPLSISVVSLHSLPCYCRQCICSSVHCYGGVNFYGSCPPQLRMSALAHWMLAGIRIVLSSFLLWFAWLLCLLAAWAPKRSFEASQGASSTYGPYQWKVWNLPNVLALGASTPQKTLFRKKGGKPSKKGGSLKKGAESLKKKGGLGLP